MWSTHGCLAPTPCEVDGWEYDDGHYAAWGMSKMTFKKILDVPNETPDAKSCNVNESATCSGSCDTIPLENISSIVN